MGARLTRAVAIGLLLSSFAAPLSVWGAAEAKCAPPRTPLSALYSDGARRSGGAPTGVESNFLNYSPWVYPGYTTFAVVALEYSVFEDGHARFGWVEYAYDVRYTVAQYTRDVGGPPYVHFGTPQPLNTFKLYTIEFSTNPRYFYFNINGVLWYQSLLLFWNPNNATMYGRINNRASQMPGSISLPEWFLSANIRYGSTWQYFQGTAFNTNPAYFGNNTQVNNVAIWDKGCQS